MPAKKIVLLGGGSAFFRTVLVELATVEELAGSEVILYDIRPSGMEIIEEIGRRALEQTGLDMKLSSTTDLVRAVDRADFAVSSIGVSGENRRAHELDITIPAKYGVFQTTGDTAGPGGLFAGFRSVPIFLNICREMERHCPDVIFLNHSNPMMMICRAMIKHTGIQRVIGLCHGMQGTVRYLAEVLEVPYEELEILAPGLNHLLWVTQIRHRGRDLYPVLREKLSAIDPPETRIFCKKLFDIYGYYPVNADRHIIEYFPFLLGAKRPEDLPYGLRLRTEMIAEQRENAGKTWEDFERQARGDASVEIPEHPSPEAIGRLIAAIAEGRREIQIVNVPNRGCIPNLPDHAIVEIQGVTESTGCRGLYTGELPLPVAGMFQARVLQQELAVDAAVYGDRRLALQALLNDEQISSIEVAEKILDELLAAHAGMLPQFGRSAGDKETR